MRRDRVRMVEAVVAVLLAGCSGELADAKKEAERMGRAAEHAVEVSHDPDKRQETFENIRRSRMGK